ncbi:MAG TPA: ABC transporter permease [Candidatus Angelobacter sp.]
MEWLARTGSFARNLFHRPQIDQELDREVSSYVELLAEQKVKKGLGRDEALRQARIELGGAAQVQEEVRRVRAGAWLGTFWQDLKYGARILRNNPGFTVVAALTFAIGIGANATIFSMVNELLLRPLPVEKPEQLTYLLGRSTEHWGNTFSYPDFEDIRNQTEGVFSDVAVEELFHMDGLSYAGKTQTMWSNYVSTNFFTMLGIRPALGSFIPPDSSLAGNEPVLVVGYSFWKSHLGGDPNIVGQHASVNGRAVTIVGVAPEGFGGTFNLVDVQGYLPVSFADSEPADKLNRQDRERGAGLLVARLKPGVTLAKAQAVLEVVANRLADQYPKIHKGLMLRPVQLGNGLTNSTGENPLPIMSALFLTLAGLVLVLAAANLANLLLVRALARNREMAVRSALGAARARLIRQVLTETALLVLLGFAGGMIFGVGGSRTVSSLPLQTDFPFVLAFPFDWRVFCYALAGALVVALICGLVPAWRASSADLNEVMRESARNLSPRRQRFRSVLVVAQVGGSLMLLIVAGLFVRSLRNVQHTDLGFDPDQVMNFTMDVHHAGLEEVHGREFYDQLLVRAHSLPGVESASLAQEVALGLEVMGGEIKIPGRQEVPGQPKASANCNSVSPDYFKVLRIPILRGRGILESDSASAMHVAVISQAMAERYWPGRDPLGQQFTQLQHPDRPFQVVGVFKDARMTELTGPIEPFFFMPIAQNYIARETLQVRTSGKPSAAAKPVLEMIHSIQPALPVGDVQSMNQVMDGLGGFFIYRLGAAMAGALGLLGLALAIVGVYGVISYSAAQRTHEIGIRMALGALPGQAVKAIFRQGLIIVGCGIVLGVLAAAAIAKLVGSFLVGVSAIDPVTYLGVSLLLAAIALLASFIPARRASRVDPVIALRHE